MPTYTYQCDSCGHGFEAVQPFADEPLTECPECGSRIRRVIQPVGVVFKGSGWYITDSRGKSSTDGAESSSRSTTTDKADKADKADKTEKPAKSDTSDKPTKTEKTTAKVAD
jgi:putative FmdB family regulatory protein